MRNSKKSRIIWSLFWAAAILICAVVLKGNPAGVWIESALAGVGLTLVVLKPQGSECKR